MSDAISSAPQGSALFRYSIVAARVLMGVGFVVFGLNKFFGFLPPPPLPEKATAFFGALFATGYMIPLIAGTEILSGTLLIIGRFVPLALVLIAPVIVNIIAFHLFLDLPGIPPAVLMAVLELYLVWCYRRSYAGLFTP